MAMADGVIAAPAVQRGCRCGGEQAGRCWHAVSPGAPRPGKPRTDDGHNEDNDDNEDNELTSLKESKRPRV